MHSETHKWTKGNNTSKKVPFAGAKKMRLQAVNTEHQKKSTFFKKSSQLNRTNSCPETEITEVGQNETLPSAESERGGTCEPACTRVDFLNGFKYTPSANDFEFNFECSSNSDKQEEEISTAADVTKADITQTTRNFYKLQVSDNSFRFNFPSPES